MAGARRAAGGPGGVGLTVALFCAAVGPTRPAEDEQTIPQVLRLRE